MAGVGWTVCRARDQCDSLEARRAESADLRLAQVRVARGVSSEPKAARRLSGQRSTTSRSRPRSRRSAAPMTPLNPPPAVIADVSRTDPLPPPPPPGGPPRDGPGAPRRRRAPRRCHHCRRPGRRRAHLPHLPHGPGEGPRPGASAGQGGRAGRGQSQRPGTRGQRGGRQHAAAHRVGRHAGDLARPRTSSWPKSRTRARSPTRTPGERRPGPDATGGHGFWLVRQVCDLVELRSDGPGPPSACTWRSPSRPVRMPGRPPAAGPVEQCGRVTLTVAFMW